MNNFYCAVFFVGLLFCGEASAYDNDSYKFSRSLLIENVLQKKLSDSIKDFHRPIYADGDSLEFNGTSFDVFFKNDSRCHFSVESKHKHATNKFFEQTKDLYDKSGGFEKKIMEKLGVDESDFKLDAIVSNLAINPRCKSIIPDNVFMGDGFVVVEVDSDFYKFDLQDHVDSESEEYKISDLPFSEKEVGSGKKNVFEYVGTPKELKGDNITCSCVNGVFYKLPDFGDVDVFVYVYINEKPEYRYISLITVKNGKVNWVGLGGKFFIGKNFEKINAKIDSANAVSYVIKNNGVILKAK